MLSRLTPIAVLLCVCSSLVCGQNRKDTDPKNKNLDALKKRTTQFIGSFKKKDTVFTEKSEDAYIKHEGKRIRKILINHIGFDRNVIDTTRRLGSFVAKLADRWHRDSKEWVIRQNLFIKEGDQLNSYRIADNERYLRDLDFILDSRIYVKPIPGHPYEVDLVVVTRDVFSLGATVEVSSPTRYIVTLQQNNLGGMGQRVQLSTLFDENRKPRFGYQMLYQKTNILGSFVNATLDYSQYAVASTYGPENLTSYYLQLSRPLFMPYARWAGGVTLSHSESINVYSKPDTAFEHYRYNIQDYWAGYSFGHKRLLKQIREDRNRKFIALRAYQQQYTLVPTSFAYSVDRLFYHNRTGVLGQVTLFRQDFYKTRFVLGFGRTEDVAYGYKISLTTGWEKEQERQRQYTGFEVYRNVVDSKGAFFTYSIKLASYFYKQPEDALLLIDLNRFSRIYPLGKFNIRHQLDLGYAQQYNQVDKRPLNINDPNGLTNFRADSLFGNQRLNLRYDVVVFSPWKVLGFHIAPTVRPELVYFTQTGRPLIQSRNFFSAFSGGLRVRNENLVFNTIEARVIYYPKTVERISNIGFSVQANIKLKYPDALVTAPTSVYNQ
jgi:hypothetical protein